MPELPEVENYKTCFDSTSLHKKIVDMDCADSRLLKKDFDEMREALIGQEFTETERIGKYLFAKTTGGKVLVLHFGMTGNLNYYKDPEDRPKFAHIVYKFGNGFHLGFLNKRKFGWNDLADSVESYKNEVGLSDDALKLTFEQFLESLSRRKSAIKPIIMNQSVAAGIGNWVADEVLYQAKIHPEQRVEFMDEKMKRTVFDKMKEVLHIAIEKQAVYHEMPEHFLIHNRNTEGICPNTGVEIERSKVGGRTTFFSPEWQQIVNG